MLYVAKPMSLFNQPNTEASLQEWIDWFYCHFLPDWIKQAQDPAGFGFFDLLDQNASPLQTNRRSVLAQARLLFTFSHLALQTGHAEFKDAANVARKALPAFEKNPGLYCRAKANTPQFKTNANLEDQLAFSYDQTFIILALSTWGRLCPDEDVSPNLELCWQAIENRLTDTDTGLLLEHDEVSDPSDANAPKRAQNPHMHLYEAALQAYEMTHNPLWLNRAKQIRSKGLEYFFDEGTGTLIEYLAPNTKALPDREGQWREIGHQCEWAWLLHREADLGGDTSVRDIAMALLSFADTHGFETSGAMRGAAFDAVSSDTTWREHSFLLWPQTEAIKTFAIRHSSPTHATHAQQLMTLIFTRYFAGHAAFINRLDGNAKVIWPQALSRLLYHVVLAITEGERAGLWQTPKPANSGST